MKRPLCGAGLMALLVGCVDPQLEELQDRLAEVRDGSGLSEPLVLPAPVAAQASDYSLSHRRNPFKPPPTGPIVEPTGGSELTPALERVDEPLERYELETLRLVGTLALGGETHGVIRAPGGDIHRVALGSYLGRNHGRVISIGATAIQLVEWVPGNGKDWVERSASLSLETTAR